MNAVVEKVCPEKKDVFNTVSLSASTITRRIKDKEKECAEDKGM